jgi:hypothetical protein
MKKTLPLIIAIIIVVGAGAFYGGMKYDQSKNGLSSLKNIANLPSDQRRQKLQELGLTTMFGGGGARGGNAGARAGNGGGFSGGQIIAKDNNSITVKSQTGGSQIVFLGASTQITKSTSGKPGDLTSGQNVRVTGATNADGSMTANMVQILPNAPQDQGQPGQDNQPGQQNQEQGQLRQPGQTQTNQPVR